MAFMLLTIDNQCPSVWASCCHISIIQGKVTFDGWPSIPLGFEHLDSTDMQFCACSTFRMMEHSYTTAVFSYVGRELAPVGLTLLFMRCALYIFFCLFKKGKLYVLLFIFQGLLSFHSVDLCFADILHATSWSYSQTVILVLVSSLY